VKGVYFAFDAQGKVHSPAGAHDVYQTKLFLAKRLREWLYRLSKQNYLVKTIERMVLSVIVLLYRFSNKNGFVDNRFALWFQIRVREDANIF
jgi:hypothetical protein